MVQAKALAAAATAALLLASQANAGGLYPKSSAVLQVDAKNYDRLIAQSNYTSIVEFYAPWCGHCKNLQPAYENAAKKLAGVAKVAAVNCDEDANKQFCGAMGVKGFPTLKIVKPGKKPGRPVVEDYRGPREARDIIDAVTSKIKNHVTKVTDNDIVNFLREADKARAILFTEKGTISALWKAIAIDFLGSISVAQVRSKEKAAVELFGVTEFPTIVLIPALGEDKIVYDGEINKDDIVKFLSQVAPPNPDSAPASKKAKKEPKKNKAEKKSASSAESEFKASSESQKSKEASEGAASATDETIIDDANPTESPDPIVDTPKPVEVKPKAPAIPIITNAEDLATACLSPKSGTCVLAFIPADQSEAATQSVLNLADIAAKYASSGHKIFPFYTIPDETSGSNELKTALGLSDNINIVAINAKRGWMRKYSKTEYTLESLEGWVDSVRYGEGEKTVLPGILIGKTPDTEAKESKETIAAKEPEPNTAEDAPEATPEPGIEEEVHPVEEATEAADPVPEPEVVPEETAEDIPKTDAKHDEL